MFNELYNDEEVFRSFENLSKNNNILQNDLLNILKKFAKTISVFDLMIATAILKDDGKYVQVQYREKFLEVYIKYFIMRIKEIKENNNTYTKNINKVEYIESIDLLRKQFKKDRQNERKESRFPLIYALCSMYATYILKEPIHPVGTPFPGDLKVEEKNGIYYCPVKEKQEDNPNAVCKLCIAKQSK
ncbi:MAG: DUF2115 domain-containing protein [Methanobacteriaceae archaeon]|jgi:uncharacterized protein (UPF0305 family)|nr:DUF2115 domain-containing protein [Methanobacteriaceae archaeon]